MISNTGTLGILDRARISAIGAATRPGAAPAAALLLLAILVALGTLSSRDRQVQVFPFNPDCPYVVRTPEENLRVRDASVPGNVVVVKNFNYGRLGNRFGTLTTNLRLGYCCRSKLVELPPKDDIIAPGVFNDGGHGPRWFDFSAAPPVEGFDASTCPRKIKWGSSHAFYASDVDDPQSSYYTEGLSKCMKALPRLLGCEAAYYFPTDMDVCLADDASRRGLEGEIEGGGHRADSPGVQAEWRGEEGGTGQEEQEGQEGQGGQEEAAAETLVIHVRSGDNFVSPPVHPGYGQPPLQFYLRAIEDQKWGRIDVVTNGFTDAKNAINPVVPALQAKAAAGELSGNIFFHTDRTFEEDFLTMMCTEGGLVLSRSTMAALLAFHSSATRLYAFGVRCGPGLDALADQLPGVKVYGVTTPETEAYGPFGVWKNTEEQRDEMMAFNVAGFKQCGSNSSAQGAHA